MRKMSKGVSLLLTLFICVSFISCGKPNTEASSAISASSESQISTRSALSSASSTLTVSSSATLDTPQTLTDQAGRQITISEEPEKIISGYYITSTTLMALGLSDKLVAIEAKAKNRPIYSMAAPRLLDLPNVGSAKEFDVDGAIALEPELVVGPVRIKDSAETMESLGIPVILVSPESHESLLEMITLLGEATGTQDRAKKLVTYYQKEMDEVNTLVKDLEDKPKVYIGGNSSYLTTAPKDMYQAYLIRQAGGENAGDQIEGNAWAEVDYETLLAMNPDVIVLPSNAEYSKEDVLGDPQLSGLTAIKNKAVYSMPGFIEPWDSPAPAGTLGLRWMLYALHEDIYAKAQLEEKVQIFYSEFYDIKEIDVTKITK